MKRLLIILTALATVSIGHAQAVDLELGHEWSAVAPRVYGIARVNVPIGEALGADVWLLPEVGVWVPYTAPHLGVWGYARVQALLDAPRYTLFVDGLADVHGAARLRAGIRLGFDIR